MPTLTWLGEPDGQDTNTWNGYTFRKGVPVEVSDPYMIAKARGNRFYEVKGGETKDDKDVTASREVYAKLNETVSEERKQSAANAFAAQQDAEKKAADLAAKRKAEDDKLAAAEEKRTHR